MPLGSNTRRMEKHDEIRRPIVRAGANGRSKWSPGKPRFDLRDYEPTEMHMSSNPTFAAAQPYRTKFVLVNDRVPRTDQRCALCGGIVEEAYVRDSQTRLIYCDTQCLAGGSYMTRSLLNSRRRKVS